MKRILLVLIVSLVWLSVVRAQPAPDYTVQVLVDSAFLRATPDEAAPAVSSVFQGDSLVAIGRNVDGVWLHVRRPGMHTPMGWIARRLVLSTFEVATLPLTDVATGVTGPAPVVDTGFAVMTTGEVVLRGDASEEAARLEILSPLVTIPVLARTPDKFWLKVNYRGNVGWIAEYLTSTSADLEKIPISPEFVIDPNTLARDASLEIIPLEVQIAQIDRLLAYLEPMQAEAMRIANFWQGLMDGLTIECEAATGNYAYFVMTPHDLVELPELRRQENLLTMGVDSLNLAAKVMSKCGIYDQNTISAAYADAINARGMFTAVARNMKNLRAYLLEVP